MLQKLKDLVTPEDDLAAYDTVLLPTTRQRVEILAGDGDRLRVRKDGDEKWVVDATSQVGTNPLGHRDPEIMDAMQEFYDSDLPLMVAGNDSFHPLHRELAETFTRLYPGNQRPGDIKAYYCNSGSEAVERGCLKSSQQVRGGNTYIAFWNGFHGRTSLALSCNFSKAAHTEGYNSLFRALPAPYANHGHDVNQCIEALEQNILREGPRNINAVIIEPVQGEGGYNVPDDEFLPAVRDITADHGIPLVMDEVQASLRTGHWFACENWDVEPDMIAVAKAFSGGVEPFGASLIKDEFATAESGKHSGTFGGNPKECYAALKTIEIIEEHDYLTHAREQGAYMRDAWEDLARQDGVVDVRGIGLMQAVEFTDTGTRNDVLEHLFDEHDVWAMGCGHDEINPSIRFLLPVNVEKETVQHVASSVIETVQSVS